MTPERQGPANPVSHTPHATVTDEHPVASEKAPDSNLDATYHKIRAVSQPCSKTHRPDDVGTRFDKEKTKGY